MHNCSCLETNSKTEPFIFHCKAIISRKISICCNFQHSLELIQDLPSMQLRSICQQECPVYAVSVPLLLIDSDSYTFDRTFQSWEIQK